MGQGVVVSRVGNDPPGRAILDSLADRGMSTGYVQLDSSHPTGAVSVFMHGPEPGYQIDSEVAWDFLESTEPLDELAARCDAVCFGSLAQRSPASRTAIQRFLSRAPNAVRLYDVNLRCNTRTKELGYSAEIIAESCKLASVIKVNCGELLELCRLFDIPQDHDDLRQTAGGFLRHFPAQALVVTRGPEGAKLFTQEGEFAGHAPPAPLLTVYPVGAGDASSAGILFATVFGRHPDDAIDLANRMGTWVASQLSATPSLPDSVVEFARQVGK